jgi:hypothetical protein
VRKTATQPATTNTTSTTSSRARRRGRRRLLGDALEGRFEVFTQTVPS